MKKELSHIEVRRVFQACCVARSPEQRFHILEKECNGDVTLQRAVQELLVAEGKHDNVFESTPDSLLCNSSDNDFDATSATPFDDAIVGATIHGYKLLQKIGEGGFGVVYMAQQTEPVRRKVGLKVIKPGMDSKEVVARFEAERQALAMMDHPNVAKVLDGGTTESGRPYFVMELVHGTPITKFCDENCLSNRERLALFVDVCRAVQHAHLKGIIHRDLKPSNVLVTMGDDRPLPKVIDFGVSKALGQALTDRTLFTAFGQMVGTPLYMSPEQAQLSANDVDVRSDVYSLGVLLYELLTGNTPFDRETLNKAGFDGMRRIIREVEPPRPSAQVSTLQAQALSTICDGRKIDGRKLSQSLRGELDWIVMKTLEKNRSRRYETVSSLADDVQRFLDNGIVTARPPSLRYRLRKTAARHRVLLTTSVLVGLTVCLGVAGMLWQANETRSQRDHALDLGEELEAQLAETQTAKSVAERQAAIANAINSFLLDDLLAGASPMNSPNRSVTLKQVLEASTKNLEVRFNNEPVVKAALHHTIGVTFSELGEFEEAEKQLQLAYELRRETKGPKAQETLESRIQLASVFENQDKLLEAEEILEDCLAVAAENFGENHAITMKAKAYRISLWLSQAKFVQAETASAELCETRRRSLGETHEDTLKAKNLLASCLERRGEYEKALKLFSEVYRVRSDLNGQKHPDTILVRANRSLVLEKCGRLNEAVDEAKQVLQLRRDVLGVDHPRTVLAMNTLSILLNKCGKADESLQILEEAVQLAPSVFGETHQNTLSLLNNLANRYVDFNRHAEGVSKFDDAIFIARASLGADHYVTSALQLNQGASYIYLGELRLAEKLYEKALIGFSRSLGENNLRSHQTRILLAILLERLGKNDEAAELLVSDLNLYEEEPVISEKDLALEKSILAEVRINQNDLNSALSLASAALEIRQRLMPSALKTLESEAQVARIQLLIGDSEDAGQAKNELTQAGERLLANESQAIKDHFSARQLVKAIKALVRHYEGQEDAEALARWNTELAKIEKAVEERFPSKPFRK